MQSPSAPLRVPGARRATGVRVCAKCTSYDRCRLHAAALSLLQHERLELGVQVRFAPPRLRHLAPWVSRRSAAASRDPARAKKPGAGRFARTAASAACELSSCLSSSASCRGAARTWAHGRRRGGAMADLRRLSAGVGCAYRRKPSQAAPIRSIAHAVQCAPRPRRCTPRAMLARQGVLRCTWHARC